MILTVLVLSEKDRFKLGAIVIFGEVGTMYKKICIIIQSRTLDTVIVLYSNISQPNI